MSVPAPNPSVDWDNLKFDIVPVNGYVSYEYTTETGRWSGPKWNPSPYLSIHVASTALNYGQAGFEGLKAFRSKDGNVRIFRPKDNAARLNKTAVVASLPEVPEEVFLEACKLVVAGNLDFVPPYSPYAAKGSFYLRPLLIATGGSLILDPPSHFTFLIWGTPTGSLYSTADAPAIDGWVIDDFDRSAPMGNGATKLAGNYAPVFRHTKKAKQRGYPITLHLDAKEHKYIDEFSTSNAIAFVDSDSEPGKRQGLTKPKVVVPESKTILRSVTKLTVVDIARQTFGWDVESRPVLFDEVTKGDFSEFAAAGTAAGITPVRSISYGSPEQATRVDFGDGKKPGPMTMRVLQELTSVQSGDRPDPFGWLWPSQGVFAEDAIKAESSAGQ